MHKVIKVVDVILTHHVCWHQVFHKRPYLCGCVADGRACGKHHILPSGLLKNATRLVVESGTLL